MPLNGTPLVRYYFDEASSGTTPTSVVDASGNSYDLNEINYGSGNLAWVEDGSGFRGLTCSSTTGAQRARRSIDNTSDLIRDAIHGHTQATIEVVMDADAMTSNGSRIFGITDRAGGTGSLMLRAGATNAYTVAVNEATAGTSFDPGSTARMVLHIVIDTTIADPNQAQRVKYAVDGGTLVNIGAVLAANATFSILSNSDLICFNRESGGSYDRSWDGVLYYAALYDTPLSQGDVTNNATVLAADDDTPGGGGGGSILPLVARGLHGMGDTGVIR